MLYFVFGRAGSGKTTYIRKLIADFVKRSDENPLLLVPEQYSFEYEKAMLDELGAAGMRRVELFSFSRLAESVLKAYPATRKPIITDAQRKVIMSMTLKDLGESAQLFSKHATSSHVLSQLVAADKELRQCRVSCEELEKASEALEPCALKTKLEQMSVICAAFRSKTSKRFTDENNELDELVELIEKYDLFRNRVVFLDSFRGFTAQELAVITQLMKRAKAVYVTVCAVNFSESGDSTGVFGHTVELAKRLKAIAGENGVPVAKPAYLSSAAKFNNFPPAETRAEEVVLRALENSLCAEEAEVYTEATDKIKIISATDITDEAVCVAREIKRLVREDGYRCRDITVIERTRDSYKPYIVSALRRQGLPVFDDSRRRLDSEPLAMFTACALKCAADGITTELMMRCLKSGLSAVSPDGVFLLDNYTVMWDIEGAAWKREWTAPIDGFGGGRSSEARAALEKLNELRKMAVAPISELSEYVRDTEGSEPVAKAAGMAVYDMLCSLKCADKTVELNKRRIGSVPSPQAVWDAVMSLLEQLAMLYGDEPISLSEYSKMFDILCEETALGVIPQGLDEITVGCADRIRTENTRAVFIVGANNGVFPLDSLSGGVFSDYDRRRLMELGLEIAPPFEYAVQEERFITYCALTAASERLCVTYSNFSQSGEALKPSEIVTHIKDYFPSCLFCESTKIPELNKIECDFDAVETLAENIRENSVFRETVKKVLSERSETAGKAAALDRAVGHQKLHIDNPDTSRLLFGEDVYISASRAEAYYKCPFMYFCNYGLNIRELRKASLDASQGGTVIHYVIENILREYGAEKLISAEISELRVAVDSLLSRYLEERMDGAPTDSGRFMFLYNMLGDTVMAVLERLRTEFGAGEFVPVEYELNIGKSLDAYTLPLDTGGKVCVSGLVDRVDIMEKNGKKYLRIIDYKTGSISFSLSDVLAGLKIQMCLYLVAINKNGTAKFGETVPAGVLYLPSKIGYGELVWGRNPSESECEARKLKSGKLDGMMLYDFDVFKGMGGDALQGYLPAKFKRDGSLSGNLYSLEEFGKLGEKIDRILTEMGDSLHNGSIAAVPSAYDENPIACGYCEYRAACGYEDGCEQRNINKMNHDEALNELMGRTSQAQEEGEDE